MDKYLYHPLLRSLDETWVERRSSWYAPMWFPADEVVRWMGDAQLYCRDSDYQHLLDNVPCAVGPDANGNGRYCVLAGEDLDAWRVQVARWLACFDEQGRQTKKWVPLNKRVSVEPTVVAGPTPPKRAEWFGRGLRQWMNRGKPE